MKNKNPIEALEIIYKVTRVVNLNAEQRLFMIISNILLFLLFGHLGSKLLHDPHLVIRISMVSIFYIIWYYITFVMVNYLSTNNNGVLRY